MKKPTIKDEFDMLYVLISSDGFGNSMFSDNQTQYLKQTQKLLEQKYGETDWKVKFLKKCVIQSETNELDTQDKEWVRYILHEESEPNDSHKTLLEDLKNRMEAN